MQKQKEPAGSLSPSITAEMPVTLLVPWKVYQNLRGMSINLCREWIFRKVFPRSVPELFQVESGEVGTHFW